MKILSKQFILALAILALSIIAVNAQSSSTDTRPLSTQIEKKLVNMPYYEVFDYISFDIQGDTVVLSGKVLNGPNKSLAENIVKDLPGVNKVVNNIEILSGSGLDREIRRSLLQKLSSTGMSRYVASKNPPVRLIVDGGRISLEGYVASRSDSDLMNVLANGVPGAFGVTNNLKIDKAKL